MGAAEDTAESGELKQLKYYRNMHRAAEANCKLSATVMVKLHKFCIKIFSTHKIILSNKMMINNKILIFLFSRCDQITCVLMSSVLSYWRQ